MKTSSLFAIIVSVLSVLQPAYGDTPPHDAWSQFRGPNGNGIGVPLRGEFILELEQAAWKRDFAKGTSSPVLADGLVFLTSFDGADRILSALNAMTGEPLWERRIPSLRKETATPPNGAATCTPACIGDKVIAFFPDAGLLVCDFKGQVRWQKDIGPFYSMHGVSASPIVVDGKVIITIDQLSESYISAFDLETGNELWKTDRLIGVTGGYSTPAIVELNGRKLIVSPCPGEVVIYDPNDGKKLLGIPGLTNAPVTVPVVAGNRFCYCEPPGEPLRMDALGNVDKNKDGVIELSEVEKSVGMTRLIERIDRGFGNGDGKVDEAEFAKAFDTFLNRGGLSCVDLLEKDGAIEANVSWKYAKTTPYIASAIMHDGLVYIVNDGGILICFEAESGDVVKKERLSNATGMYYASPIIAGDKLVTANLEGKLTLLTLGRDFETIKTVDFGEPIVATPSVANGRLYVRTDSKLYCF